MAAIFELNVAVTNTRSSSPTCVVVAYGEPDRVRLHIGDQIKLHATQLMRWATHQPDSAREVVSISPDRGSDSYTLTAVRAGTLALSYSSCHGTAC